MIICNPQWLNYSLLLYRKRVDLCSSPGRVCLDYCGCLLTVLPSLLFHLSFFFHPTPIHCLHCSQNDLFQTQTRACVRLTWSLQMASQRTEYKIQTPCCHLGSCWFCPSCWSASLFSLRPHPCPHPMPFHFASSLLIWNSFSPARFHYLGSSNCNSLKRPAPRTISNLVLFSGYSASLLFLFLSPH